MLKRSPSTMPVDTPGNTRFAPGTEIILQCLPSGQCFTLALDKPVILGRGEVISDEQDAIDLTQFNAVQHGVSRTHCSLERWANQLVVTDLGSTNGTFLNGESLLPFHRHAVAHGDKLILGSLHFYVSFANLPPA
ncbi:MAG: FHA domain-containing protein [Anaerolineae bacterium]|nr:FHA domain-containing protein [Anaerolineae bacterium]